MFMVFDVRGTLVNNVGGFGEEYCVDLVKFASKFFTIIIWTSDRAAIPQSILSIQPTIIEKGAVPDIHWPAAVVCDDDPRILKSCRRQGAVVVPAANIDLIEYVLLTALAVEGAREFLLAKERLRDRAALRERIVNRSRGE